jgi:imidazolonepropionase-like amidohydrolase
MHTPQLPRSQTRYVLTNAKVFDPDRLSFERVERLLVADDIVSAADGDDGTLGSAVWIDCEGSFVIPGLIDVHVHLRMGPDDPMRVGRGSFPGHYDLSIAHIALRALKRAQDSLAMGFTTLRDVGDIAQVAAAVRDAISEGYFVGPRIFACGQNITATGGAGDHDPSWLRRTDVERRVADGEDEIRRLVRRQTKEGADWIKFFATGTFGQNPIVQDFTLAEMQALVDEATRRGRKVCAHCCYREGTKAAVLAGVASVEHGNDLDSEILDLMAERGTYLVPTLAVFFGLATRGTTSGVTSAVVEKAKELRDRQLNSVERARRHGIPIALGSDIGSPVADHGSNAEELCLLVEAGLSPAEALQAATQVGASLLGIAGRVGRLVPGFQADLLVLADNPLDDIRVLTNRASLREVFVAGTPVHRSWPALSTGATAITQ